MQVTDIQNQETGMSNHNQPRETGGSIKKARSVYLTDRDFEAVVKVAAQRNASFSAFIAGLVYREIRPKSE